MTKTLAAIATTGLLCSAGMANVLWDNGPLVNRPGEGFGGADASRLQTGLGMNTLGGNVNRGSFHRADDFEVGPDGWILDEVVTFAYQTNAGPPSTLTGISMQIWDASPAAGGSVIWGDMTTDRFVSTDFSGAYRDSETSAGSSARPIMEIVGSFGGLVLPQGTYWLEVGITGSAASGPWMPAVTIDGQTTTGNALQFSASTSVWSDWLDTGTSTPQGMPFSLVGEVVPAPGAAATLALAGLVGLRRRR